MAELAHNTRALVESLLYQRRWDSGLHTFAFWWKYPFVVHGSLQDNIEAFFVALAAPPRLEIHLGIDTRADKAFEASFSAAESTSTHGMGAKRLTKSERRDDAAGTGLPSDIRLRSRVVLFGNTFFTLPLSTLSPREMFLLNSVVREARLAFKIVQTDGVLDVASFLGMLPAVCPRLEFDRLVPHATMQLLDCARVCECFLGLREQLSSAFYNLAMRPVTSNAAVSIQQWTLVLQNICALLAKESILPQVCRFSDLTLAELLLEKQRAADFAKAKLTPAAPEAHKTTQTSAKKRAKLNVDHATPTSPKK